jgi:hypothetical protein
VLAITASQPAGADLIIDGAFITPSPVPQNPGGGFAAGVDFSLHFTVTNGNQVEIGVHDFDFSIFDDDAFLTGADDFLGHFFGSIDPVVQIAPGVTTGILLGPFTVGAPALNGAIETFLGIDLEGDLEPFATGVLSWFEKPSTGTFHTTPFTATPIPEPSTLSLFATAAVVLAGFLRRSGSGTGTEHPAPTA